MVKTRRGEFGIEVEREAQTGVIQGFASSSAQPTVEQGTEIVVLEQITPAEDNLPTVGGHAVTLNEWASFQTHALTGSVEQAAIAGHVTTWSIWRWRRTARWKALHSIHVETHQQKFHDQMAARAGEICGAYFAVMRGDEKFGKTANAVIQGAKLFMQSGHDPIIKAKPVIAIQNNTQVINAPVVDSIAKNWTQDQLNEYARTGKKPEPREK